MPAGSGWTEMPDSDPIHDNPRNTSNLPAVVKEGEVMRPTADNWLTRAIRTLFGWKSGSVRDDLQVVLDASTPDEVGFSAIERTMLRNILSLHERRIADVMIHRADIVAVKRDIPLGELMSLFESAAHSRLVVYNDNLDDPEGIVHIRDLLAFMTATARAPDTSKAKRKKPLPAGLDLRAVNLAMPLADANIIRNLLPKRPIGTAPDDDAGIGIYVEADTSVTGNVIENAPSFGIIAGWGKYLRDVVISGNVIRNAFVGIGVSVTPGAGTALVNNNMISETPRGAVVGLDHARPITPDLAAEGAQRFAQVVVGSNAVRR